MPDQIRQILSRLSSLEDSIASMSDPAQSMRTSTDAFSSSLNNLLQTNKVTLGGSERVWPGFDNAEVVVFEVQQGAFNFFPYSAAFVLSAGAQTNTKNFHASILDADSIRHQCWNFDNAVACLPMKWSFFNGGVDFQFMEAKQTAGNVQPRVAVGGATGPVSGTGTVWIRGGNTVRICDAERTPAGVANLGDMCFDTGFLYIYTSAGWKKATLI